MLLLKDMGIIFFSLQPLNSLFTKIFLEFYCMNISRKPKFIQFFSSNFSINIFATACVNNLFFLFLILLARFLALVTTMVTKVDHGNHRSNDRGNNRSNDQGGR